MAQLSEFAVIQTTFILIALVVVFFTSQYTVTFIIRMRNTQQSVIGIKESCMTTTGEPSVAAETFSSDVAT